MTIDAKWFRAKMSDAGLSQRALARKLGLDQSAISLTFSGRRNMKFDEAAGIARLIGYPVSEVLQHAGVPIEQGRQTVPITGYLDGHGEIHCFEPRDLERTLTPQPMPDGSACIQCRTAETPLAYMDGWMLFREPPAETPTLDQFSLVKIRNGIRTLGTLRRGYRKGRWNLAGPCCTMTDIDVEWAAVVAAIRTI